MKNYLKEELRHLPFFLALIVVFYAVSVVATEYLFSSSEVNYDNTRSNMAANNVQDAVDELYSCATNFVAIQNQIDALTTQIYPVGSIYLSVTDSTAAAVSAKLGGTWEAFGEGRTLVGVKSGDATFGTVNNNGGNSTVTLEEGNLPAHTHSIPALSGTAQEAGSHSHTGNTLNVTGSVNNGYIMYSDYYGTWGHNSVSTSGAFSTYGAGNYNGGWEFVRKETASGSIYHGTTGFQLSTSGKWSGSTSTAPNHTHTVSTTESTSGSTGSGTAFSVQNPYVTVYMWKRTA